MGAWFARIAESEVTFSVDENESAAKTVFNRSTAWRA